ncbi:GNAT family N-acetyltransferase [Tateyamaria omphalii]|uniref:GNAT family N-acetyltransferase n=1 Tax=Tateyamaria omphalii TaxID=299262 RepID=UPI00167943FD|nr:GNAT family N-acetyltransferase [Tateyamaria omphalii]GGX46625.1 GNAT family N-acetyltransferase [Tateyamaria omphalii]
MMTPNKYAFRRVTMDDVDLLLEWRSHSHVREWWGAEEPHTQEQLNDPRVSRWIVSLDGCPFAYMQDYTVHGWRAHHFAYLPDHSRGIDQYIGDPEYIGLGHGPAFIAARMQDLFNNGAPVIATDPHPENQRAINAYQKLGFEVVGPPEETRWGVILPMLARR